MNQSMTLSRQQLRTPRAAAIAGIVFSILLMIIVILMRISIPDNPQDAWLSGSSGTWLSSGSKTINLALNLLPFAGIAFLWFIGVIRDRLGELEDRFFATVFLGSGLLFLAMLFASAAVLGGVIEIYMVDPQKLIDSGMYNFGHAIAYQIMNVYAIKMAGVFMIATSTLSIRTEIAPRWISFIGYALAAAPLLSWGYNDYILLLFPLWVLLLSTYMLIENLHNPDKGSG
jgi:hypothetical protein